MPEVNTRFEQLLHGDVSQTTSFLVCILRSTGELGIAFPSPCRSTGRIIPNRTSGKEFFISGFKVAMFQGFSSEPEKL
jgi:hypothetical protein